MNTLRKALLAILIAATASEMQLGSAQLGDHVMLLSVAKHVDAADDGAASIKLLNATALLRADDATCNDLSLCMRVVKVGPTGSFGSTGDGLDIITSQAELLAVLAVNTHDAKVVTAASNSCGTPGPWLGCGTIGQRNMVLVRNAQPDVWAHQFGHGQGLLDNTTCPNLIMNSASTSKNAVTAFEASVLITNPDSVGGPCADTVPLYYCTSKTAVVCAPSEIAVHGTASASATSGFDVVAVPTLGLKAGKLIYTNAGPAAIPFQGGVLCVNPAPILFSTFVGSGGTPDKCDGAFSIDMNAFGQGLLGGNPDPFLLVPGTIVNVQWWGRDSIPTTSLLTDAVEYAIDP